MNDEERLKILEKKIDDLTAKVDELNRKIENGDIYVEAKIGNLEPTKYKIGTLFKYLIDRPQNRLTEMADKSDKVLKITKLLGKLFFFLVALAMGILIALTFFNGR